MSQDASREKECSFPSSGSSTLEAGGIAEPARAPSSCTLSAAGEELRMLRTLVTKSFFLLLPPARVTLLLLSTLLWRC